MTASAIPTPYAGVRFRSRLEARWAAFFDLVGWKWEYEPLDLTGYIPDFILAFHKPLLVEVKPIVEWPCPVIGCGDERCRHDAELGAALRRVRSSGWTNEAIVVGAYPFTTKWGEFALGHFLRDK